MEVKVRPLSGRPLVEIRLSRRNLLALLTKLAHKESKCQLFKVGDTTHPDLLIKAEPDSEHYQGRTPGQMAAFTEADIKDVVGLLKRS